MYHFYSLRLDCANGEWHSEWELTSDVEVEVVALSVALGVVGGAGVDAAVGARHLLQHEALVRDDHLLRHVVAQLSALQRIDIAVLVMYEGILNTK